MENGQFRMSIGKHQKRYVACSSKILNPSSMVGMISTISKYGSVMSTESRNISFSALHSGWSAIF